MFTCYGFLVWENKKVLEMGGGGDGCATMWMYLVLLKWTLTNRTVLCSMYLNTHTHTFTLTRTECPGQLGFPRGEQWQHEQ